MAEVLYYQNDNLITVDELKDTATGAYLNTATVTLTAIQDAAGATVSGETFPKTLAYVASSNGKYQAVVDKLLAVSPGRAYTAVIDVVSASLDGHWELPLACSVRTG